MRGYPLNLWPIGIGETISDDVTEGHGQVLAAHIGTGEVAPEDTDSVIDFFIATFAARRTRK